MAVRRPGEEGSAEEWRRFGQAASVALDELSDRMVQFARQISEQTSLLRLELGSPDLGVNGLHATGDRRGDA